MTRYPNGTGGPHFWEKEVPKHAPAWLARWHYESPNPEDSHTYAVADRVAALAFLANQAAIELHPWTSRTEAAQRPTYALIDIDPGPKTTWPEVLVLARLYRTALGHLAVRGYPKVTGKRASRSGSGRDPLHVRGDIRWVEALSRAVGATVPELISGSGRSATGAASSSRLHAEREQQDPRRALFGAAGGHGAGLRTIDWDELDDPELRPDRWTMTSMPARLAERGDLFAGASSGTRSCRAWADGNRVREAGVRVNALRALFLAVGGAVGVVYPFIAVILLGRGFDVFGVGVVTALSAVAFTASVPIWGHVADVLLGRPRALQVSAIGGGLALAVTLLPVPPVVVAICFVVFSAFESAFAPLSDALAVNGVPDARRDYARVR